MSPFITRDGVRCWYPQPGDAFVVTGLDRRGRRFRLVFADWAFARLINVYRGSFWLLRDGRKWLIQRRYN